MPGCRADCRNFLAIPNKKLPANFVKNVGIYINSPQILVEI